MTRYWLGKKRSLRTKNKIRKSLLGRKMPKDQVEKVSIKAKEMWKNKIIRDRICKAISLSVRRENNHTWEGDNVKYEGSHTWIHKNWGQPIICEICKNKRSEVSRNYHWANRTGIYDRNPINWIRACVWCHNHYDRYKIKFPDPKLSYILDLKFRSKELKDRFNYLNEKIKIYNLPTGI